MKYIKNINNLLFYNNFKLSYMEIALFIKDIIPHKELSDYAVRRNYCFESGDFRIKFLTQSEIELVNSYKSLKRQIEWIAGRFLVKSMLKEFVDNDVELLNVQISYKEEGSPFIEQFPFNTISISHSGDYVAAALSMVSKSTESTSLLSKKIGIDIEKVDRVTSGSFMSIAFTQKEIDNIAKFEFLGKDEFLSKDKFLGKDMLKHQEIMRRWTIKEAYLKYIGRGFNEKLKAIEVFDHDLFYNGNRVDVQIQSFHIDTQYLLSMVC